MVNLRVAASPGNVLERPIACLLSLPAFVVAVVWMTIGVMALGHQPLESFPSTGIRKEWLRGYRAAFVWFYHRF